MRGVLWICLLVVVVSVAGRSEAGCERQQNPVQGILKQLQSDTEAIFGKFAAQAEPTAEVERTDEDFLIVPGSRVGGFELSSSLDAISSAAQISKTANRMDSRYAYILPVAYVPPRLFATSEKERLVFAFKPSDEMLAEIFVKNPKYHTAEHLGVGASVSEVIRTSDVKKRTAGRESYFVGDGIVFVVKNKAVTEIVVTRRK